MHIPAHDGQPARTVLVPKTPLVIPDYNPDSAANRDAWARNAWTADYSPYPTG